MKEMAAGLIVGLLLGLFGTGLAAVALARPGPAAIVAARWAARVPFPVFTVGISCGGILLGGLLGTLFGLTYLLLARLSPGEGLASPNLAYTSLVALAGLVALGLAALARLSALALMTIAGAVTVLGWLLPWLAS